VLSARKTSEAETRRKYEILEEKKESNFEIKVDSIKWQEKLNAISLQK